jgi:hypothetical protein
VLVPLAFTLTAPLAAQTEADLKRFKGKRVTLKIDMLFRYSMTSE